MIPMAIRFPPQAGTLRAHGGEPLSKLAVGSLARIVHLEDEPEVVYAQLLAEGLHLGEIVRVTEVNADRVRFWANGDEHVLAPIVAANISVRPLEKIDEVFQDSLGSIRLSMLEPGETAEVDRHLSCFPWCGTPALSRSGDLTGNEDHGRI